MGILEFAYEIMFIPAFLSEAHFLPIVKSYCTSGKILHEFRLVSDLFCCDTFLMTESKFFVDESIEKIKI